uniref:Uncharacterized protein n=1 Tax=Pseudonaja textilis TaxID=8673 RepID=A0A670Y671_PSETE
MTLLSTGSKAATRLLGAKNSSYIIFSAIHTSAHTVLLKDVLANIIPKEQARL